MEQQIIRKGDFAMHKFLNKGKKLYVTYISGTDVTVRYVSDEVFYKETFKMEELEPYKQKEVHFGFV